MSIYEFIADKKKYVEEPWRLRVHLAYLLIILFAFSAEPATPWFTAGSVMLIFGVLIRAWASGIIKKDDELATGGPYSLCRNPLYVGNFLIGYGFCFINGNPLSFVALTGYFLLIYPFTIRKEERKLARIFSEEFEEYRKKVNRFWPRLSPYTSIRGWKPYQYFVDNKDFLNEGAVLLLWFYTAYLFLN